MTKTNPKSEKQNGKTIKHLESVIAKLNKRNAVKGEDPVVSALKAERKEALKSLQVLVAVLDADWPPEDEYFNELDRALKLARTTLARQRHREPKNHQLEGSNTPKESK